MSANDGPIAKRAHRKSRGGCRACKLRKVKCDEGRPVCHKCFIHFSNIKKCDYPADPVKIIELPNVDTPQPEKKLPTRGRRSVKVSSTKVVQPDVQTVPPEGPLLLPSLSPNPKEALVKHYHTTLVVYSFPFFTRGVLEHVWWPTIQTDDLLYHTILLLNSLHLEKLQQGLSAWRSQTKELMRECISILRSRIDDGSVPIETIMSVAILASIAAERGDVASLKMHTEGLVRMIYLRGGMNAIREQHPLVANMISWMTMVAIPEPELSKLHCEPDRSPIEDFSSQPQDNLQDPWPLSSVTTTDAEDLSLGFEFHDSHVEPLYDPTLGLETSHLTACPIEDLKHLTTQFSRSTDAVSADDFIRVFTDLCSVMQRLLTRVNLQSTSTTPTALSTPTALPTPTISNLPYFDEGKIYKACCTASALFVLAPLRNVFPDPSLLVNDLVQRLRTQVSNIIYSLNPQNQSASSTPTYPDIPFFSLGTNEEALAPWPPPLLWLLSIGAASSIPQSAEHRWFLGQLRALLNNPSSSSDNTLSITSWPEFQANLKTMMWNEVYCETMFGRVWDEVEELGERLSW